MGTSTSHTAVASTKTDSQVRKQHGVGGNESIGGDMTFLMVEESFTFVKREVDTETETESESESEEEYDSDEECDYETAQIIADVLAFKTLARAYMHPEDPVPSSPGARCFFNRASALDTVSREDAEGKASVLADVVAFKQSAVDFAHPEFGVSTSGATACARNYFTRASAPEVEDLVYVEERAKVLAEVASLKQAAVDYAHPEISVKSSDPTVFGRNFFDRVLVEDVKHMEECVKILADVASMRNLANAYMHPEVGVKTSDATTCGRNYFSRPSAIEVEDGEERARILAEAAAFKQAAVDYMHPEVGVKTIDPSVCARNFFSRPSAVEVEDGEERALVLAEAAAFKQVAVDYMHPEVGVKTIDPSVCARNFFSRPSAVEVEDGEERARVLAEAAAFKQVAVDYMHPEVGVKTCDVTACGRNYYDRFSVTDILAISTVSTTPDSEPEPITRRQKAVSNASDMFDFDDDVFCDMREAFDELQMPESSYSKHDILKPADMVKPEYDEVDEEGNLSRSPSSVMLFGMGMGAY